MKSKFWRLLKLQMIDQSGFNRYRNEKDYKKKNKQLLYVLALGFVGVMMISYSSMLAGAMVAFHMGELIPMFSMTISSVVALVYTMTKANSTLFAKDDYEILMALPIPLRTMIATRFTSLYISNVAFSALVMVPMAVAYAVGVRPGAIYYILLIPGILLANVVPTLIATMIAALATLIASRFRKVKGMQAVLSILLIVGIFSISFLTSGKNTTEMQVKQIIKFISEKIRSFYPLAGMYQDGVIKGNIMALLLFVGISVTL